LARPDFAVSFFWKHNVLRFIAPFDHAKPIWFYLPGLALGLLPWALLIPGLVILLMKRGGQSARQRPAELGFVLGSFIWMLIFFSAAGCKRPTYLLPALPPLALALGWGIQIHAPSWRALLLQGSRLATATAGLGLLVGVSLALTAALLQVVRPALGFALASVALLAFVIVLLSPRRLSWATSAGVVLIVLFAGIHQLLPAYNRQFSVRGQLRQQDGLAKLTSQPVVCYPLRYDSVSFYLPNSQVRVFGHGQKRELIAHLETHPGTLVLIKSGPVFQDLVRDLPSSIHLRARQRGSITVGQVVHVANDLNRDLASR
jgi:4-amino-4-deoxy-L-arabinose transferase-like glycosyltransferase